MLTRLASVRAALNETDKPFSGLATNSISGPFETVLPVIAPLAVEPEMLIPFSRVGSLKSDFLMPVAARNPSDGELARVASIEAFSSAHVASISAWVYAVRTVPTGNGSLGDRPSQTLLVELIW